MSHGPFGLGGGTLAPACSAIVNVAPISVSASASISTRSILVFMFILFPLPGLFRHLLFLPGGRRPCGWNCSNPVRRWTIPGPPPAAARRIRSATRSHIRQAPAQHPAPRAWMLQQRLSSLSHRASDTRVSGIIRDFQFELPGTVQYTFTRYFSTRKSASVAETAHDSAGSRPILSLPKTLKHPPAAAEKVGLTGVESCHQGVSRILCKHFRDLMFQPGYANVRP